MPGLLHLAVTEGSGFTAYHFQSPGSEHWLPQQASHWGAGLPSCPRDPGAATSSCCMGEPLCPSHLLSACGSPFLEDR